MANTLKFGNGNWATKEDSVLAYNDENNNFKPLPFDFTRASTATYVDSDGLIKTSRNGEARIDYTDSTDGALLLEPSRSNLITYSQDFSNYFVVLGVIAEAGFTDPSGNTTAFKLSNFANASSRFDYSTPTPPVNGTTYTYSAYYKGSGTIRINCSTTTGVGGSGEKEIVLTDEWKREEVSFTALNATGNVRTHAAITRASNNDAIVYLAFTQIEAGSYATSYIPTSGSAATRVADVCEGAGNDQVMNSTEGVLYFEGNPILEDLNSKEIQINGGNLSTVRLQFRANGNVRFYLFSNSAQIFLISVTIAGLYSATAKVAIKYKSGESKLYINGNQIGATNTSTFNFPTLLSTLSYGGLGGQDFYGNTKDLRVYNTALTDAELATLTT